MFGQRIPDDGAIVGQVSGKLQDVSQLPHITRPIVKCEAPSGLLGDGDGSFKLLGQLGQHHVGKGGNVLPPVPQGGIWIWKVDRR